MPKQQVFQQVHPLSPSEREDVVDLATIMIYVTPEVGKWSSCPLIGPLYVRYKDLKFRMDYHGIKDQMNNA